MYNIRCCNGASFVEQANIYICISEWTLFSCIITKLLEDVKNERICVWMLIVCFGLLWYVLVRLIYGFRFCVYFFIGSKSTAHPLIYSAATFKRCLCPDSDSSKKQSNYCWHLYEVAQCLCQGPCLLNKPYLQNLVYFKLIGPTLIYKEYTNQHCNWISSQHWHPFVPNLQLSSVILPNNAIKYIFITIIFNELP